MSRQLTGCHPSWSSLIHLGFFLVHSYACVGLYQFSTVIYCRLARAQKYRYAKVTTKIAIVPRQNSRSTSCLFFFCKTYWKPWALSATASAATGGPWACAWSPHHWQCPVHFFWRNSSKGGEVCIHF
jgi:hypothetical protein